MISISQTIQKMCYLLLLSILMHLTTAENQYVKREILLNQNNYTNAVYTPDLTHLLLFAPRKNTADDYQGYNYRQLQALTLQTTTTFVTGFTNKTSGETSIFYWTQNLFVRQRNLNSGQDKQVMSTNQFGPTWLEVSPGGAQLLAFTKLEQNKFLQFNAFDPSHKNVYLFLQPLYAAKWFSDYHLIVSMGDQNYFQFYIYNTTTDQSSLQTNLTFLAERIVIDFAVKGNVIYFIEMASLEDAVNEEQTIKVYDVESKMNTKIAVPTSSPLKGINVKGNFMEVTVENNTVLIYNLASQQWYGEYPSVLQGYGLSPDGSDLLTLNPQNRSQFVVYKLCDGDSIYYDASKNTCQLCQCLGCFFNAYHCYNCGSKGVIYNFTCCSYGCKQCTSNVQCTKCANKTWEPYLIGNNTFCRCPSPTAYLVNQTVCISCSQTIEGCAKCTYSQKAVCFECQDGYTLNEHRQCQADDDKTIIIVIAVGGTVVVAGVIGIAYYFIKKRRSGGQRLLGKQSEGPFQT